MIKVIPDQIGDAINNIHTGDNWLRRITIIEDAPNLFIDNEYDCGEIQVENGFVDNGDLIMFSLQANR